MPVLFGSIIMIATFTVGQIVANSRYASNMGQALQRVAQARQQDIALNEVNQLRLRVYERALHYDRLIEADMLEEGMVVNRGHDGAARDFCDSLLFSSLRYVALNKLGLTSRAQRAWQAIKQSRDGGQWFRHPRCAGKGTSRDMMLGVLAAFSQDPEQRRQLLMEILDYVERNNGFIGSGRIDVSYLLPGVADFLRIYAQGDRIVDYTFPINVRHSFSTMEFSAMYPPSGYRSHLVALSLWLEIELEQHPRYGRYVNGDRSAIAKMAPMINPFSLNDVKSQRYLWSARQLFVSDPKNLFFKYLWLRSAKALNKYTKRNLMAELLSGSQPFPVDRLPANCDRKADYLWQRHSWEYEPVSSQCDHIFSGVDFLWMAALLLENDSAAIVR